MAWETNLSPIEYLDKRMKFYIRLYKKYRRLANNPELLEKYQITEKGIEVYTIENMERAANNCRSRYLDYEQAIFILSENILNG